MSLDSSTTVNDLRRLVAEFVAEREWQQFHDPKNLSMAIAIEAAELMEHFQWVRSEAVSAVAADVRLRGEVSDELADITCFVLAMANALDLDLASCVQRKMAKNRAKYPAEQFRGLYYKPPASDAGAS